MPLVSGQRDIWPTSTLLPMVTPIPSIQQTLLDRPVRSSSHLSSLWKRLWRSVGKTHDLGACLWISGRPISAGFPVIPASAALPRFPSVFRRLFHNQYSVQMADGLVFHNSIDRSILRHGHPAVRPRRPSDSRRSVVPGRCRMSPPAALLIRCGLQRLRVHTSHRPSP